MQACIRFVTAAQRRPASRARAGDVARGLRSLGLFLALACGLSGCGTPYLLQAARGQWQVMHGREPLATVIARPQTDPSLRARLDQVRTARDFASSELLLPDNASYRTYRALGRPFVVWNVVATPEFSVQPRQWCFPFTGCIAYRGYFAEPAARQYAERLRIRGDDVHVGGVAAYSTLGHFADPLLDTMLRSGELDLIGTLFHELAHQRLYAPGDSAFNESFAMAVEYEGLRRWLVARGREAELQRFRDRRQTDRGLQDVLLRGRDRLRALFAEALPATEMRARKADILRETGDALLHWEADRSLRSGYDEWVKSGLNNAQLVSIGTYHDCVAAFDHLLAAERGDLAAFYADARALARGPAATRQRFCASP
jgi:predicted aminopeptidase